MTTPPKLPEADNKKTSATPPPVRRSTPPPIPPVFPEPNPDVVSANSNPWRVVGVLCVIFVMFLVGSYYVLVGSAKAIARSVPYETETSLFGDIAEAIVGEAQPNQELQALANKLARAMEMDEAQPLTVYIDEEDTVNAYATFGGHVVFYQGLLNRLESEQAVAMVLAHELAHVKHRDPLVETAGSFGVQFAVDYWLGTGFLSGQVANLTQLSHSREAESRADETGFKALAKVYGTGFGMDNVYDVLGEAGGESLEWLSSHPDTNYRKKMLENYAKKHDIPLGGDKKPNIWKH